MNDTLSLEEEFPEEACGECPYCGRRIAVVEIESADAGVRFERVEQPPEDEI